MVAAGDYPCWVYDPTGLNPPQLVQNDPQFVALLNAPLPSTAGPAASVPATAPPPLASVTQSAAVVTMVGGTTQPQPGARWTKAPGVNPASPAPVFVNKTPHVVGKR